MNKKIICFGIISMFLLTAFAGVTSATSKTEKTEEALTLPTPAPKLKGIIARAYVMGDATSGKQFGRIALIDFSYVGFEVTRLFPLRTEYADYEDVSVLIIGLESKIPAGSFYLNTKDDNDRVLAIIL